MAMISCEEVGVNGLGILPFPSMIVELLVDKIKTGSDHLLRHDMSSLESTRRGIPSWVLNRSWTVKIY